MPGLANSSSKRPKVSPVRGENTLARHCSLGPDCAESLKGMKATYLCRTGTIPLDIDCESGIILMVFLPQPVTHTFKPFCCLCAGQGFDISPFVIFSSGAFVSLPELELTLPRGHCFSCSPGAAHQDQEAEMLSLGSWFSPRTLLSNDLPSELQVLLSMFTSLDTPSHCQRSSPLGSQHFLTPNWE